MAKIGDFYGPYTPKSYAGRFSFQGTNEPKPKPQWPPSQRAFSEEGTCNFHHCTVCKKPVKDEPHGGFCGELKCKICDDFMMFKKPITSRHYTGIVMDDLVDDPRVETNCGAPNCKVCEANRKWLKDQKSKKEVKMHEDDTQDYEYQTLYEVTTTYGADRDKVTVKTSQVVAEDEKRALMQSADDVDADWDMDYVEQHVHSICNVRVKRKPREILATK